jgi:acetamidase/formamidase
VTDQLTGVLRFEPDAEGNPTKLAYTFGGFEPLVSVRPGTTVSTWTMDCFAGRVRSTSDLVSEVCDPRFLNPQTGPFFVEGAEPGDTLVVHFRSITPREAQGVSTTVPLFGSLTATGFTAMLHPPLPERTWVYAIDTAAGVVRYDALDSPYQVDLPLDPMHGTVGVAPALGEVRSSLTPGSWGGNMDTPEMRAGTTCYLGVNVPGALFSLGDGHARQGEGETCGVAVECAMDTVLVLDLVRGGTPTPWPRLEDAFRIAHTEMVRWVQELAGLSDMDAYQLVSQTALTPVANVVDTNYTVVAKVPKRVLPDVPVMQGMHARWRRT